MKQTIFNFKSKSFNFTLTYLSIEENGRNVNFGVGAWEYCDKFYCVFPLLPINNLCVMHNTSKWRTIIEYLISARWKI